MNIRILVTIQLAVFREVFWHEYAKIPRHTSQNAITAGDLECILARNCEGTEQLRILEDGVEDFCPFFCGGICACLRDNHV